jgi:hypothetical protein
MNDVSKGTAFQRYAYVNAMILEAYKQECVDFKYDNFVKQMSQIDWNSSAAEGGLKLLIQIKFKIFMRICFHRKTMDLSNLR